MELQRKDPTAHLQVHGSKCKVHIDAEIASAAEAPGVL